MKWKTMRRIGLKVLMLAVCLMLTGCAGFGALWGRGDEAESAPTAVPSPSLSKQPKPFDAQRGDLRILSDPELYTYDDLEHDLQILEALYPEWVRVNSLAQTVDEREIYDLVIGRPEAENSIFVNAGIHAREYMTSQLVMKQAAVLLDDLACGREYEGTAVVQLMQNCVLHIVPMVNPDGISLSQMGLDGLHTDFARAKVLSIASLDGETASGEYLTRWKSNLSGVDLNRNFDALWASYDDGTWRPSSERYKGMYPGSETESAALITLTQEQRFDRTISYHAQGGVIYWYFAQSGALYDETLSFAERIGDVTGYKLDDDYEKLDPAGYKDWAISKMDIPSLTIEIGRKTAPVPHEQFEEIWEKNQYVLTETLLDVQEE